MSSGRRASISCSAVTGAGSYEFVAGGLLPLTLGADAPYITGSDADGLIEIPLDDRQLARLDLPLAPHHAVDSRWVAAECRGETGLRIAGPPEHLFQPFVIHIEARRRKWPTSVRVRAKMQCVFRNIGTSPEPDRRRLQVSEHFRIAGIEIRDWNAGAARGIDERAGNSGAEAVLERLAGGSGELYRPSGAAMGRLGRMPSCGLECESACKKDPLFGVIGIQTGPR